MEWRSINVNSKARFDQKDDEIMLSAGGEILTENSSSYQSSERADVV
jgi:hypothetical protein